MRTKLNMPLIITEGRNTCQIFQNFIQKLANCNHHEADTRIVLYASKSDNPVVVVGTDTGVLILVVYA